MGVLIDSRPIADAHIDTEAGIDENISILPPLSASKDHVHPESTQDMGSAAPQAQKQTAPLELVDRYIDEPRPLKVAVIGGGLAGILAGVLLPAKVPGVQLTIYEKNKDFVSWLRFAFHCLEAHPSYREEHGSRTFIPVSAVTYRLMFINRLLSPKRIGPTSLHLGTKFGTTGSLSLKSTMCTSMPNLSTW